MREKMYLDISVWTIVKLLLVLLTFYLLFLVRDIIALLFIVFVLVATLLPVVARWSKKIGRIPAVISVILIFIASLALLIYIVVPPVIDQVTQFIVNIPNYAEKYGYLNKYVISNEKYLRSIAGSFNDYTGGFIALTTNIFGGIITVITVIVLSIYLLMDETGLKKSVMTIVPPEQREGLMLVIKKLGDKVGDWLGGQILLAFIVAVIDFVALTIIGVPLAIMLAVLAGILEFVPVIGPIIAGVVATFIAFTDSPVKAVIVIVLYVAVQQLENLVLVPKIMQKAVGLSPIIIIVALLIGAKLLGVIGAVLAIPIAASLSVLISEWSTIRKVWEHGEG